MPDIPGTKNPNDVADFSQPKTVPGDVATFTAPPPKDTRAPAAFTPAPKPAIDLSAVDWSTLRKLNEDAISDPVIQQIMKTPEGQNGLDTVLAERAMAKFLDVSPELVQGNLQWYQAATWPSKALPPAAIPKQIENTITANALRHEQNQIGLRMALGTENVGDRNRLAEITTIMPPEDQQLSMIPRAIVDFAYGNIFQLGKAALVGKTNLNDPAEKVAGGVALSILGMMSGVGTGVQLGRTLSEFTEQTAGAAYLASISAGLDRNRALGVTIALTAINAAASAIPGARAATAGVRAIADKAIQEAVTQTLLKGVLVTGVKAAGEQAIYGYSLAAANVLAPEIAKAIGKSGLPGKDAQELLAEIGIEGTLSTLMGTTVAAASIAASFKIRPGGALDLALREQTAKREAIPQETIKVAEPQKPVSTLPAPLQKRIEDIVKLSDKQVSELDAQTKSAESSSDYIKSTDLTYKQGVQDGKDIVQSAYLLKKYISDIAKVDETGLPEEFASPIRELKANFTTENFRSDTVAKLKNLQNDLTSMAIDNRDISPDLLRKIGELDKLPYSKMALDDVKTIRDAIVQYQALAREDNRIKVGEEQRQRAEVVAAAIKEAPAAKPEEVKTIVVKNPDGTTTTKEVVTKPSLKKLFDDKMRDLNNTITTKQIPFDDVVDRLGPTAKTVIAEGMHEGTQGAMKYVQDVNAELKQKTSSIPDQAKWFQEMQTFGINDTQVAVLPRSYKLALYMHTRNPENRAHLTGGDNSGITLPFGKYAKTKVYKITESALGDVIKSVENNPQEKLYVDTVASILSRMGKDQAVVYARRNNIPLELVENYYRIETAPLSRKLSRSEREQLTKESSTAFGVGPSQGHLKERTGSTIPLVLNPITHDLAISRDLAGAYIHLSDPSSNAVKLIRDPDYARKLAEINPDLQRNLIKGIRDINHNHDPIPDFELASLRLRNNMGMGILAMPNEWPAIKQTIAMGRYANYVDTGHLMSGILEAAFKAKQSRLFLERLSPEFVDRIQGGQSREMADILRQSKGQEIGGKLAVKARLMTWTRWGDAAVVQAGMLGAYKKVMEELDANSLSPIVFKILTQEFHLSEGSIAVLTRDQKIQLAIKYADYATEHTQAMSMPQFQSDMQRGSPGEKALTLFMSENMASLNMFRRFVHEARTAKSAEAPRRWGRAVKAGLIVFGAEAMANMFINRGRREVTGAKQPPIGKDIAAALVNAPLQGAPLLGAITQASVNATLLGWDASNFSLTPMQAAADLAVKFGVQMGQLGLAPGGYQRQKAALSAADSLAQLAGMYFGVPYQPLMTNIKMGIHLTNAFKGGE